LLKCLADNFADTFFDKWEPFYKSNRRTIRGNCKLRCARTSYSPTDYKIALGKVTSRRSCHVIAPIRRRSRVPLASIISKYNLQANGLFDSRVFPRATRRVEINSSQPLSGGRDPVNREIAHRSGVRTRTSADSHVRQCGIIRGAANRVKRVHIGNDIVLITPQLASSPPNTTRRPIRRLRFEAR
jgi:hypothetical protein